MGSLDSLIGAIVGGALTLAGGVAVSRYELDRSERFAVTIRRREREDRALVALAADLVRLDHVLSEAYWETVVNWEQSYAPKFEGFRDRWHASYAPNIYSLKVGDFGERIYTLALLVLLDADGKPRMPEAQVEADKIEGLRSELEEIRDIVERALIFSTLPKRKRRTRASVPSTRSVLVRCAIALAVSALIALLLRELQ